MTAVAVSGEMEMNNKEKTVIGLIFLVLGGAAAFGNHVLQRNLDTLATSAKV